MPPRLPPVLSSADLPLAELLAARLDGDLFRLGDAFAPADELDTPRHRARAVHAGFSARVIAEQRSAAWIWGALDGSPVVHDLCVAMEARVRLVGASWVNVREVVIEPQEIATLDGLQVTTPLRTAIDLARFSEAFGAPERDTVARLMRDHAFTVKDCLDDMARRRNLPNKRLAAQRLNA
jgi:hypothetical protein